MAILTEDLKKRILATKWVPAVIEIEKSTIVNFTTAVEDPNPLWQPGEGAKKGPYGDMIVPPGLLHARMMLSAVIPELPADMPLKRILDGGADVEYFIPIRPGDKLKSDTEWVDVFEREGATGSMISTVFETRWTNQKGELVGKCRSTLIRR